MYTYTIEQDEEDKTWTWYVYREEEIIAGGLGVETEKDACYQAKFYIERIKENENR